MLVETNRTFIALIAKTTHLKPVSQFRPIGLHNMMYKIISNCLVLCLKSVVGDIVGDYQNSFVLVRLLADNGLQAHEMMKYVKNRKKGREFAGVLKIDLNKAYDRIQ